MKRLFSKPLVSLVLSFSMLVPAGLVGVHAKDNVNLSNYGQWVYSDVQVSDGGGKTAALSDDEKQKVVDEINKAFIDDGEGGRAGLIMDLVWPKTLYDGGPSGGPVEEFLIKQGGFAFKVNGIKNGEVTVKLSLPEDDYWKNGDGRNRISNGYMGAGSYALILQYHDSTDSWTYDQVSVLDADQKITFTYEKSDILLVMYLGDNTYFDQVKLDEHLTMQLILNPDISMVNVNTDPVQEVLAYNDTNPNTPHIENIEWMSTSNVSKGWDDGTFRPMDTVKRQDMAAFLRREAIRLGVKGVDTWKPSAEDWKRFKDVNQDTPHAEDILWLASTGITTGYEDGTYQGMWPVYRQDMAAFLHRLAKTAGFDKTGTKSFTDVNASTPHAEDISWLGGTGISTGYADGTYQGMWPVYRQDMAAFINRLDNFKN